MGEQRTEGRKKQGTKQSPKHFDNFRSKRNETVAVRSQKSCYQNILFHFVPKFVKSKRKLPGIFLSRRKETLLIPKNFCTKTEPWQSTQKLISKIRIFVCFKSLFDVDQNFTFVPRFSVNEAKYLGLLPNFFGNQIEFSFLFRNKRKKNVSILKRTSLDRIFFRLFACARS